MRITFIGDIMCEPPVLAGAKQPNGSYNFDYVFAPCQSLFSEADYLVGNLETPFGDPATEVYAQICKNAAAFPNVIVINGWNLIPHNTTYFGDKRLHPNNLGCTIYTANLYQKIIPHLIKKIGYSFD